MMQESQGRSHHLEGTLAAAITTLEMMIETRDESFSLLIKRITEVEKAFEGMTEKLSLTHMTMQQVAHQASEKINVLDEKLSDLYSQMAELKIPSHSSWLSRVFIMRDNRL
ncbi:hypothetical protein N9L68_09295 [bacterium]|nr:hypothetical protein [bacterium]